MGDDCIFCKIVKGKIESVKIWEDDEFLAILDNMPNTEGMTLVMTKEHYDSYAFDMPKDVYQRFMLISRKVAKILENGLDVKRVAMVMEGMGINHAHMKLYPLHGLGKKFAEMWADEKVYFKKYEGFITTKTGEKKSMNELKKVANKIKLRTD